MENELQQLEPENFRIGNPLLVMTLNSLMNMRHSNCAVKTDLFHLDLITIVVDIFYVTTSNVLKYCSKGTVKEK